MAHHLDAYIPRQRHFSRRDGEAAVGEVMSGGDQALAMGGADEFARAALVLQIDLRRVAFLAAMKFGQPCGLAEMACGFADQDDRVA